MKGRGRRRCGARAAALRGGKLHIPKRLVHKPLPDQTVFSFMEPLAAPQTDVEPDWERDDQADVRET
jgi:hypothetical protein